MMKPCSLCEGVGGVLLVSSAHWRLVRVVDVLAHPAFYRVIAQSHHAECTDLPMDVLSDMMQVVWVTERLLRQYLQPTKINIASLGNVVPHVHWHVVARFETDSHFPDPIWSLPQRAVDSEPLARLRRQMSEIDEALQNALVLR